MRRFFKSYTSFTRIERMGLIALTTLLLLLVLVKATMHLWVKPATDDTKSQQLTAAWEAFKNGNNHPIEHNITKDTAAITGTLFPFDPNTLDSAGFRKLGLPEKTTSILLHWRAKGKVFRKKEELKSLYTLTPAAYERLAPYISIKDGGDNYRDVYDDNEQALPATININTADSATLIRLKGIGPAKAHKILEYRKNTGSFTNYDQLQQLCHFPQKTFEVLKQHLKVR